MTYKTLLAPFSIIPRVYEEELDKKNGIKLGQLKNGEKSEFRGDLEKNVFFNGGIVQSLDKIDQKILQKYKSTPGFCSMTISSGKHLLDHVKNIHELSYNHYVFGKEIDMKDGFPDDCCGVSSNNLLLTLMEKGYPNAAYLSSGHNHAYVGLPFVLGLNQEKGFILVDPTSDQLFNNKTHAPRNYVFVAGTEWEYITDWENGNDLYPSPSRPKTYFSNLQTLRDGPSPFIEWDTNITKFLKEYLTHKS